MPIGEPELNKRAISAYQIIKTNPDYKVGIKDNFLIEIITKRDIEKCTTKYMQIQNTLWIQLHTNQDWIGIAPREELIHICCSDKIPRHARKFYIPPRTRLYSNFRYTAILTLKNLLKDKIKVYKTIRLTDQKTINDIYKAPIYRHTIESNNRSSY